MDAFLHFSWMSDVPWCGHPAVCLSGRLLMDLGLRLVFCGAEAAVNICAGEDVVTALCLSWAYIKV